MRGHWSCNWNENTINRLTRSNMRASLVPAAAVIPAHVVYIKIVAVKKLVVDIRVKKLLYWSFLSLGLYLYRPVTLRKLERLKQSLNTLAWNNRRTTFLLWEYRNWLTGTVGGISIQELEVKFLDFLKTN